MHLKRVRGSYTLLGIIAVQGIWPQFLDSFGPQLCTSAGNHDEISSGTDLWRAADTGRGVPRSGFLEGSMAITLEMQCGCVKLPQDGEAANGAQPQQTLQVVKNFEAEGGFVCLRRFGTAFLWIVSTCHRLPARRDVQDQLGRPPGADDYAQQCPKAAKAPALNFRNLREISRCTATCSVPCCYTLYSYNSAQLPLLARFGTRRVEVHKPEELSSLCKALDQKDSNDIRDHP